MTDVLDLADRLDSHQHTMPGTQLRNCMCPMCPDLREAAAELRQLAAERSRLTGDDATDLAIVYGYELGEADATANLVEVQGIEWCTAHDGVLDEIGPAGDTCDLGGGTPCTPVPLYRKTGPT